MDGLYLLTNKRIGRQMFGFLPSPIVAEIFQFDSTYHDAFHHVRAELLCPELTALLRTVHGIKSVVYGSDDGAYFLTDSGDMYLVVCSMVRLVVADSNIEWDSVARNHSPWLDYFEHVGLTCPTNNPGITDLAKIYGWPSLLKCEEGFERSVEVRGRKYYVYRVYRSLPDNQMHHLIRNNLFKVHVTLA